MPDGAGVLRAAVLLLWCVLRAAFRACLAVLCVLAFFRAGLARRMHALSLPAVAERIRRRAHKRFGEHLTRCVFECAD